MKGCYYEIIKKLFCLCLVMMLAMLCRIDISKVSVTTSGFVPLRANITKRVLKSYLLDVIDNNSFNVRQMIPYGSSSTNATSRLKLDLLVRYVDQYANKNNLTISWLSTSDSTIAGANVRYWSTLYCNNNSTENHVKSENSKHNSSDYIKNTYYIIDRAYFLDDSLPSFVPNILKTYDTCGEFLDTSS